MAGIGMENHYWQTTAGDVIGYAEFVQSPQGCLWIGEADSLNTAREMAAQKWSGCDHEYDWTDPDGNL